MQVCVTFRSIVNEVCDFLFKRSSVLVHYYHHGATCFHQLSLNCRCCELKTAYNTSSKKTPACCPWQLPVCKKINHFLCPLFKNIRNPCIRIWFRIFSSQHVKAVASFHWIFSYLCCIHRTEWATESFFVLPLRNRWNNLQVLGNPC